ncbi:MAG: transglutaminase-like cysteine peptidase [Proteobacteria bacterium]|nr:transglutaminase-like cysteine peptidase [Pseudomonadota bacterium]
MSKANKIIGVVGLFFTLTGGAVAQQTGSVSNVGAPTTAPLGFTQFCRDYPQDCVNRTYGQTSIALTESNWRQIVKINADVNNAITPATDMEHWGVPERWDYAEDGKGDCEDYVLEKRRRLMKAGFPIQTLLITVVRDHKGEGHAVLTVKTDRGDFVLDNQVGKILAWQDTGYRFIKRQSDENPMNWVSLGGVDTRNVASARR